MQLGEYLGAQRDLAPIDVDVLAAHVLGVPRSFLYSHPERGLDAGEQRRLEELVGARRRGVPVAYLVGRQEFWSLELHVDSRVLIPRPETELLVETALTRLRRNARVLDLGTGSGAIAIALARERPDCRVTGSDHDANALDVARLNAKEHGADITFQSSDWFASFGEPCGKPRGGPCGEPFDVIVSNPPYVAERDPHLDALASEPRHALVAGPTGLDALTVIVRDAPRHLAAGGWLLVEHSWDQASAVRDLYAAAGFAAIESVRDLAGHERVTLGRAS